MPFIDNIFYYLDIVQDFYWTYIGFALVTLFGLYLTIKTDYFQFKVLRHPIRTLRDLHKDSKDLSHGTHPFKLYFASVGGMIGIGNIITVVTVITIGGPGGIFWLWIASFAGMMIKYSEIYLGMIYRVKNKKNSYDGGPMYYLEAAFGNRILSVIVAFLLCIYGVEIYQFNILVETIHYNFHYNKYVVVAGLIILIFISAIGGIKRFSNICAAIMPIFLILYIIMCSWVIICNFNSLIAIIPMIFKSAFQGHSAISGFAGATVLMAAQQGTSRAVYSADIGIGYDTIMQSDSKVKAPEKQAKIAIYSVLSSAIICTFTSLIILVTDFWKLEEKLHPSQYVEKILGNYFPFMDIFMFVFICIAASTTVAGFLVVGIKCAKYLHPKYGEKLYLLYALIAFSVFSFFDQSQVLTIMFLSGGLLMMCNIFGLIKLRKHLKFH